MMLKLANNATSLLASSIGTGNTTLILTSGTEDLFPTLSPGDWFPVVVVDSNDNHEIMRCTARSGVTLTVQRAQEGTVAKSFAAGSRVDLRVTAATIAAVLDRSQQTGEQAISTVTGLPDALDAKLEAGFVHAAAAKATPVDADELVLSDSAASWSLKKLTWANLKAALVSAFVSLTGTQTITGLKRFTSNLTAIGESTGAGTLLEVISSGPGAAAIAFHRSGVFAAYIGIDTDNRLKIGGWSMGANAYEIWHQGRVNAAGWAIPTTPTENGHVATKQYVDGRTTISSQVQAEAGADNATMMTPLRTAQAIAARSPVGLYTGSNEDETIFPLGHIVSAVGGADPPRNQTGEVRIAASINLDYTIGGSGALLAGTWRARGRVATSNKIMQRVA